MRRSGAATYGVVRRRVFQSLEQPSINVRQNLSKLSSMQPPRPTHVTVIAAPTPSSPAYTAPPLLQSPPLALPNLASHRPSTSHPPRPYCPQGISHASSRESARNPHPEPGPTPKRAALAYTLSSPRFLSLHPQAFDSPQSPSLRIEDSSCANRSHPNRPISEWSRSKIRVPMDCTAQMSRPTPDKPQSLHSSRAHGTTANTRSAMPLSDAPLPLAALSPDSLPTIPATALCLRPPTAPSRRPSPRSAHSNPRGADKRDRWYRSPIASGFLRKPAAHLPVSYPSP